MGLFDMFKKKDTDSAPKQKDTQPEFSYGDPKERKFWELYAQSLRYKDRAKLTSALDNREVAYREACIDAGYKGMACHNLAILYMYHIGNGQKAAKYALESLSYGDEYYRCSQAHLEELQFGAHLESLQTAAMTAGSYDEALKYVAEGEKLYGAIFTQKREEIEKFRKEYPRYFDYQRMTSLQYYSRVSAEQDQGDYAPAMSLLQLMLDRAEDANYDLSYEEYVDILDDYVTITAMYMMKKARILNGSQSVASCELAHLADGALTHIAAFLPDCQPGDRQKFENIVMALSQFPGVKIRESYEPFLKE